jgi:hypothetical protein
MNGSGRIELGSSIQIFSDRNCSSEPFGRASAKRIATRPNILAGGHFVEASGAAAAGASVRALERYA